MIDLIQKAEDWIQKNGYPLEYYTQNIFTKEKFISQQGNYVDDGLSLREIDVDAEFMGQVDGSLLKFQNIVECKMIKDKPWIVFCSKGGISSKATIGQTLAGDVGNALLEMIGNDPSIQNMSLFNCNNSMGHSAAQAFNNEGYDKVYNTIQSIVSKTFYSTKAFEHFNSSNPFQVICIGFPVIVVDGELFKAEYDAENDRVQLSPTTNCVINWKGFKEWGLSVRVSIITKNYVQEFAKNRYQECLKLFDEMAPWLRNIKQCYEQSNVKLLRGYHDNMRLPRFLSRLG